MLGLQKTIHEAEQLHHELVLPQVVPQLVDDNVLACLPWRLLFWRLCIPCSVQRAEAACRC